MSSPSSRRSNRNSTNGTPRRSQRSSQAPASSPSLPNDDNAADQQLRSEASSQQNGNGDGDLTPRGTATRSSQQSQAPPTSSPLFFRSSPGGSESQSQSQRLGVPQGSGAVGGSSPLRRQVQPQGSSEGGRTPRANGGIGGMFC